MEKPPAVLCVQLKRFSLMGGKIGKPIQLCRSLNINPFLKNGGNGNEVKYLLRSMITHVGPSPNCGHYTAIGEAANGQFFQFDDSSVRPISMQQVLRTASYVVFYEMTPASWAVQLNSNNPRVIGPQMRPAGSTPGPVAAGSPRPAPAATASRPTFSPTLIRAPSAGASSGSTSGATGNGSSPRPSPQIQPRIINKLGVVSSAAKTIVSNAISDIAKTSLNQFSKADNKPKGGLVSYDSDSGSEPDAPGASTAPKQHTGFVPRAVTMKNLVEKPNLVKTVMDSKPVRAISATARNWTVTDVETHNPSVHSDNSTGSTSGSWIITPQRPSSAMSVDGDTASVNSKVFYILRKYF